MGTTQHVKLTKIGWDTDLVLETQESEPPQPKADQVHIDVEACGVCYRDCIDRDGRFKFIRIPITPGHEVVGHVTAVGPKVTDFTVGDRVGTMHRDFCGICAACTSGNKSSCTSAFALPGLILDGGYASTMFGPQRVFFSVPPEVPAAEAAIMHCTFGTSLRGLRRARFESGQHVVITGANGGVGISAIQVAKRLGARVTAIVRDGRHEALLEALGADKVLVDPGDGFHRKLRGDPAHVVLDCVGPPTFNASMRSLESGGRVVVIGNVVQEKVPLNLGYVVVKGIEILGSSGANRADMADLFAMQAEAPFQVQIEAQLPLAEADAAQRRVRAGGLQGRIVLVPTM